ncbi:MAG TPA: hypothetical protein DCZ94_19555 [Lentisphaeria bacterium]|nr:MAG: hypothetical protein A2X48_23770 [Lentisphaerae bacterium GWF2_49_21]HBC89141.1 hypothetical protein [Lentisphaeria bacterium]
MSLQRCTIWSRQNLNAERLSTAFAEAGILLHLDTSVIHTGVHQPNTPEIWQSVIDAFPKHAFSGEAKWCFHGENKAQLKGTLTWPIVNPGDIPATIEFSFAWDSYKSKRYQFRDASLLVKVIHALSESVSATSLVVEPERLPLDLADMRFQRFKKMHGELSLTNVDWVFGLRVDDAQNKRLQMSGIEFAAIESKRGFAVYALTKSPLDYDSPEDMKRLHALEMAIGLL